MAQAISLQAAINFVQPILKNQPLLVSNEEPALTAANMVLGTMLGPPMKWAFNRQTYNFGISLLGGTDYSVFLSDFSFLESQYLVDSTGKIYELNGATSLARESGQARPTKVALQFDDNAGNHTYRFNAVPNQNYVVFLDYQKSAALMGSTAAFWGTVPDRFNYIYHQGFLAMMSLLVNDARFPIFQNFFLARLLGAQDGLTDQERDIFLGNWANVIQTMNRATAATGAAAQARGRG